MLKISGDVAIGYGCRQIDLGSVPGVAQGGEECSTPCILPKHMTLFIRVLGWRWGTSIVAGILSPGSCLRAYLVS